jgi:16S rRNA (uracil1498-N3)-methyltransferase
VPPRFFASTASTSGDLVTLPEEEGEHLARVLRLGAGDAVRVFNGHGAEFEAVVESAGRDAVRVRLGAACEPAPEPRLAVTLAQAVLKGDKMDDVVRDAVMMGAATIRPVVTTRTEVSLAALERGHRRERWERVAIAAAKQCGRAVVPPIMEPVELPALKETLLASWLSGPALMLVEPGASKDAIAFRELEVETPKAATAVVGPEGGWAPEEIEGMAVVCRLVTMGHQTLRADTMGVVALAALFTRFGEY